MAAGKCRLSVLSLFCVILYVCNVNSTEFVPVFIWESSSNPPVKKDIPALATVSSEEFKDLMMQRLQNKAVVVIFAEENLSVEDLSWQDEAGSGAFPNLENISHTSGLTYLPFVHGPLHAFHPHSPVQGREWYHLKIGSDGLSTDAAALNETYLFVNLDDASSNEDRPDLLKRHDAVISQVYKSLVDHYGDVLAVYTAHHSSWQSGEESATRRVRRLLQNDEDAFEIGELDPNSTVLLYAPNMTLTYRSNSYELSSRREYGEDNNLVLEFDTPVVIKLKFFFEELYSGYWTLTNVNATVDGNSFLLTPKGIQAPLGFSYHCSQDVTIEGDDGSLVFSKLQLQALYEESEEKIFGDAYDCIYFFTVPIWSGLFVCTIFSLIMAFGLCMIMDIKTMDRFDDPKGKTITINTSE